MSLKDRLLQEVETRTGYAVAPRERLTYLEESDSERRAIQRELDLLAYTALDYVGGAPQELRAVERRKLAQKARVVWMKDPQAGAAIDLMNDFTFGRGIPKPKADDKLVQEVIDESWDDPDNQEALTTVAAQTALGTDLSIQSNLFVQVFDDGEDGKVKLGILQHDSVDRVVRDPENRLRILYYVATEHEPQEEDYARGEPKQRTPSPPKTVYYEHWRNVDLAREEAERGERALPKLAPPEKTGDGKIFHLAINRATEMAFGHPTMDRLLRWYTAYNKFMDARVDIMEASAAFVMKRKVKGTPAQLKKMATQALSRSGAFGSATDPEIGRGPRPASVLEENEEVTHEDFNINTNAPAAAQDAQMLRSQISAATRFPQSYYGDASNSNLATATSLELPVLKAVEARQEIFERLVRFFIDRVIERAVDAGRIPSDLTDEERAELEKDRGGENAPGTTVPTSTQPDAAPAGPPPLALQMAHEDAGEDEDATERDLSYQFSMPSPLKRMMSDLTTAIQSIAQTFDPNGTNIELSRVLLTIALGEALEMEDPGKAVEKIFPKGYSDPALQGPGPGLMQVPPPGGGPNEFAPTATGADGDQHTAANPYSAPMRSTPPELAMQQAGPLNRFGEPLLESAAARRVGQNVRRRNGRRRDEVEEGFDALLRELEPSLNGR